MEEYNQTIIKQTNTQDHVDPISQITDEIYLGQGRTTQFPEILSKIGITHIISAGHTPHNAIDKSNLVKLELTNLPDRRDANIVQHFPIVFDFIRKALDQNGKIYIHCAMGCSRSPTLVIAFLRAQGICASLQEAYNMVISKRQWVDINDGFATQLTEFFMESLVK